MARPDPKSWLVVEPGWKVLANDGSEVGKVHETLGDHELDIFDGLAISTGLLAKPTYVPSEHVGDSIMDPVARVDAALEAWSSLRAALETIGQELDASRQSLREAKEQLSVLRAENDQQQVRIDALEAEVTERKTLVDEARLRLQDAAKALGAHGTSDELL